MTPEELDRKREAAQTVVMDALVPLMAPGGVVAVHAVVFIAAEGGVAAGVVSVDCIQGMTQATMIAAIHSLSGVAITGHGKELTIHQQARN